MDMLTDIRYAIGQLRGGVNAISPRFPHQWKDIALRALDALERVEAKLTADPRDGSGVHDENPQTQPDKEPAVKPRKPTFEQWMQAVDDVLGRRIGLSSQDLPDCCYRDWYDNGVQARHAAARAIKNAIES